MRILLKSILNSKIFYFKDLTKLIKCLIIQKYILFKKPSQNKNIYNS